MAKVQVSRRGAQTGGASAVIIAIIGGTIALEGGYVNDKDDPGGATRFGVTERVARANGYAGPMRTLPREIAVSIYYRRYIIDPGYGPLEKLDAAVLEEIFDTTVNMGARRPSQWFQQSMNELCGTRLVKDGKVGPATIGAFERCQRNVGATNLCTRMLNSMDAKQAAEYRRIVRVRPVSRKYLKGWMAHRINNVSRAKCSVRYG